MKTGKLRHGEMDREAHEETAGRLHRLRKEILRLFPIHFRREIPGKDPRSDSLLGPALNRILDELELRLMSGDQLKRLEEAVESAKEQMGLRTQVHAQIRSGSGSDLLHETPAAHAGSATSVSPGISTPFMVQTLDEFRIFRKLLLRELNKSGPVSIEDYEAIQETLDREITQAAKLSTVLYSDCSPPDSNQPLRPQGDILGLGTTEENLRILANLIPQLAWMTDSQGNIFWYNRRWYEYTGGSPDEILGRGWERVLHPDQAAAVIAKVDKCLADGLPWEETLLLRRRDGNWRWFLSRALPVCDGNGHVTRWIGTSTDVTEQKELHEAMRRSEERFKLASRATEDAIWDWNLETGEIQWNEALRSVFGYNEKDLISDLKTWDERIHPDDRERVNATLTKAISGGFEHWEDQYRFRHKDGTYRYVVDRGSIIRDSKGKPVRMIGAMQDETVRKKAELALEKEKRLFQGVIEQLPAALWITEAPTGKIILSNSRARNILQQPEEQAHSLDDYLSYPLYRTEGLPYTLREYPAYRALVNGESIENEELMVDRSDGSKGFLRCSSVPYRSESAEILGAILVCIDISELKQIEGALRESEARFRTLMNTVPHIVWLSDPLGDIQFVSRQWEEYTGNTTQSGYLGKLYQESIHPDDLLQVKDSVETALAQRGPVLIVFRLRRADGEYRWNVTHGNPFFNEHGEFAGWIGTTTDIHEQKLTEARLEAARAELKEILMQAPAPLIVMTGPEHRISLVNPLFEKIVRRDVLGKTLNEAFTKEEVIRTFPLIDRVYETGEPCSIQDLPITLRDEDGVEGPHLMNINYTALRSADGSVSAVTAMAIDVTEQVRARQYLQESEEHFRQISNALPQIIWTATPDFEIDWYNEWWYKYLGLPRGTTWDDPKSQPMHPEDVEKTRPRLRESVETGKDFVMEQRFRRASDGQYRWHLVRGVPVRDPRGRIIKWIGANTDIHDHKLLLEQLEKEREAREHFVAALSHDLRTPLTAARLTAQLAGRSALAAPEISKLCLRIIDNLDRMDDMIRDLLDANRIRAQEKIPLEITDCNLRDIVANTLDLLTTIHGSRFVMQSPPVVQGNWDCNSIRRIVENLCVNAVKYGSPDRPVTVQVAPSGKDEVRLSVHNWGTPIPEKDQKMLFQPYRRTESAQSGKKIGWGLGLTLVKGLAEAHGGHVSVQSDPQNGTTFTVILPVNGGR